MWDLPSSNEAISNMENVQFVYLLVKSPIDSPLNSLEVNVDLGAVDSDLCYEECTEMRDSSEYLLFFFLSRWFESLPLLGFRMAS